MRISSHMLDVTSSRMLAVRRLANCYIQGMKPIEQIRRENLTVLVGAEPSQAAFARKVRKDKNQVNQWLGRSGSRNISAEIAREIEEKCGKPRGWMDHDRSGAPETQAEQGSQSVGLDSTRLALMIECLEGALLDAKRELDPSRKARILTLLYADPGIGNTREAVQSALRVAFMAMG